jgi:hypothetical protein
MHAERTLDGTTIIVDTEGRTVELTRSETTRLWGILGSYAAEDVQARADARGTKPKAQPLEDE